MSILSAPPAPAPATAPAPAAPTQSVSPATTLATQPPTAPTYTDWRSKLPEDIRSAKVFESVKGNNWDEAGPALAKQYMHAQSMVGADKLVLPSATSTPEEVAAFYTKLGRPEKFDGYGITLPEGLKPEQLDQARVDEWRKEMHEAGLPKIAAERLLNKYLMTEYKAIQDRETERAKAMEQDELAVKAMFGPKYDEKVNFARFAIRQFGNDKIRELFDASGFGSNPEVISMLAKIGESMASDTARTGVIQQQSFPNSPELAQASLSQWQSVEANHKALFDKMHPNHDKAVQERRALFEAAYPSQKAS